MLSFVNFLSVVSAEHLQGIFSQLFMQWLLMRTNYACIGYAPQLIGDQEQAFAIGWRVWRPTCYAILIVCRLVVLLLLQNALLFILPRFLSRHQGPVIYFPVIYFRHPFTSGYKKFGLCEASKTTASASWAWYVVIFSQTSKSWL